MKRSTEILMGVALLLTFVSFVSWFFCLAEIQTDFTLMRLDIVWLAAFLLAVYFIDIFMSSKGTNLSLFIVFQLVFMVLGAVLFIRCAHLEPNKLSVKILDGVIFSFGVCAAATAASESVKQRTVVTCFDALIIMLGLAILLDHYVPLPALLQTVYICIVAIASTLLALISARVGMEKSENAVRGNPAAGRLLIAAVFVLVAGVTILIAVFAFGGMQSVSEGCLAAITACLNALKSAATFIWELVERFFEWLAQFYSPEAVAPIAPEAPMGSISADMVQVEDAVIPAYFYYILAGIAAALVAFVLYKMRGERISPKIAVKRRRKPARRENGLADALKALLHRAAASLRYRVNCYQYRKTAPGLLAYCEKHAGKAEKRRSGESGEKYLLRLSLADYPVESRCAFASLAAYVERSFYSVSWEAVPFTLYKAVRAVKFH